MSLLVLFGRGARRHPPRSPLRPHGAGESHTDHVREALCGCLHPPLPQHIAFQCPPPEGRDGRCTIDAGSLPRTTARGRFRARGGDARASARVQGEGLVGPPPSVHARAPCGRACARAPDRERASGSLSACAGARLVPVRYRRRPPFFSLRRRLRLCLRPLLFDRRRLPAYRHKDTKMTTIDTKVTGAGRGLGYVCIQYSWTVLELKVR